MIENAFGVPILLDNYHIDSQTQDSLVDIAQQHLDYHGLEIGDAQSTASNFRQVHEIAQFKDLSEYMTELANKLWISYGLSSRYEPIISETWINKHSNGGATMPHIHSGSMISASYYFQFEQGNGNIKFTNPLEYHQCHELRETDNDITVELEQFDIVMFPGILKHYTEANTLQTDRYVLTFNFGHQDRKPVRYNFESR